MAEKSAAPEQAKPSLEQWRALYEEGAAIKALAPWTKLSDLDIIAVVLPEEEEPYFCVIMGNGGKSYGVVVYPGYNAFFQLIRQIQADQNPVPMLHALEQRSISCHFGDREELEKEDREVIKQLGLRFRGRGQWMYFRAMKPGVFPWMINAEEADCLCRVMPHLLAACRCCMEGGYEFKGDALMWWAMEDGQWRASSMDQKKLRFELPAVELDMEKWAPLKKKRKLRKSLELDAWYLPIPIQENRTAVPRALYMVTLLDRRAEMVLDERFAEEGENPDTARLDLLFSYIEKHGRPADLYVRDMWVAGPFIPVCELLEIKLHTGEPMDLTDDAFVTLLSDMVGGMGDADMADMFDELWGLDEDDGPGMPDNVIMFPR